MICALDGRLLAVGQCIVGSIAFQGEVLRQNDLVFCVAGLVNRFNRILKFSVRPDPMRLRHSARRRQRQHADRYAQRLPNLPVHRFLPFLRFIIFLYTACKMDTDIIAYRHSFFNLFYTNSQLKCLTERIRFFVLTKPSEVRRTGGTLNGTRQSQSEKDGARIKPF